MKEIKLTMGKVALVDDDDYEYINQFKWSVDKHDSQDYAKRFKKIDGKMVKIYMHRLIMNTSDFLECDHIDHNGLNNQKNNLRNCLPRQNKKNNRSRGICKYLGVAYNGKYIRAQLSIDGVKIHIGYFKTEEAAARAYDKAALKYFGQFANLNFKNINQFE